MSVTVTWLLRDDMKKNVLHYSSEQPLFIHSQVQSCYIPSVGIKILKKDVSFLDELSQPVAFSLRFSTHIKCAEVCKVLCEDDGLGMRHFYK